MALHSEQDAQDAPAMCMTKGSASSDLRSAPASCGAPERMARRWPRSRPRIDTQICSVQCSVSHCEPSPKSDVDKQSVGAFDCQA